MYLGVIVSLILLRSTTLRILILALGWYIEYLLYIVHHLSHQFTSGVWIFQASLWDVLVLGWYIDYLLYIVHHLSHQYTAGMCFLQASLWDIYVLGWYIDYYILSTIYLISILQDVFPSSLTMKYPYFRMIYWLFIIYCLPFIES